MSKHALANKWVVIKATATHPQFPAFSGGKVLIEDAWMNIDGRSWKDCDGNPACLIYAFRAGVAGLPTDDNVLYGKLGAYGVLVHESEIAEVLP